MYIISSCSAIHIFQSMSRPALEHFQKTFVLWVESPKALQRGHHESDGEEEEREVKSVNPLYPRLFCISSEIVL